MKYMRERATFDLRQPWITAVLLIVCIPLFPEYVAPFLAIGALIAALRDARQRHGRLRVGGGGKATLALISFFVIHLLWAKDRAFSAITCLGWIVMLFVYLAISTVLTEPRRVEGALFALSAVAGILGLLACVQYGMIAFFGKEPAFAMAWYKVDSIVYALLPRQLSGGADVSRVCATFSDPDLYAQFSVLTMPFVAAYGFSGQRNASKILARMALLFSVAGLLVTFSRGAYLALGAIAVVMCMANIRRLVPVLTVFCSVAMLLSDMVYDWLATSCNATSPEHVELWGIAMQTFLKAPLFGHGAGVSASMEALSAAGYHEPHVHNVLLQMLTEGGILGVVLLLMVLWKLFRTGFELIIHTPQTRMYGAAILSFGVGFCACGMLEYPLFTPKLVGIFMVVLGITDALGFLQVRHASCTVWQALPFFTPLHDRLEAWVQKKTAPKE